MKSFQQSGKQGGINYESKLWILETVWNGKAAVIWYYCKELMSYGFYIYMGITFEQIMQHYLLALTLCFTLAMFTISLHKL